MKKESYYVNLNPISMDTLSPTPANDGQTIEYEIEVTPDEKKALEDLLHDVQAHDMELGNMFTFRHFDDLTGDSDRNEYQRGLNDIFEAIYQYGTNETKQKLDEIHLINDDQ
ncbi:hypothetical protein [Halalkalibacterium ligniniphilum]|uniref:hypothetical protein n=1 Tax=Halalkalibacterium ligniniphilum TaxID=1134413 RepID=UPI000348B1AF|nr:hypothetical protein [Halalkalibacterium ligniniphilum]